MRAVLLAAMLLVIPHAAAEFGETGPDGWPLDVDGNSTNPFLAAPLNQPLGATVYPYWPILKAEVERLAAENPDRVQLHIAGKSNLGLDIFMLEIADFGAIKAGTAIPLEQREVMWVDGGTHSNEYSGVYFTLAWAQFLIESGNETADWIVENRHTWVMPMVNPDGSNAFGRLNANLVNVNRNYPVVWDGKGHDAVMNNRGPYPASEVETRINIEWLNKTMPDYYASIHCCGNLWLYPYGEEGVDPVDETMLSRICDEVFPEIRKKCGPIWSTIYPASGTSVDTAYEYTGTVAFAYEMSGRGAVALWGQPVTFENVMVQERESWSALLHAAKNVHLYGAHLIVESTEAVPGGFEVTLRNIGWGDAAASKAHAGDETYDVPAIPSGGARTVFVKGGEVKLEYAKRVNPITNLGLLAIPLETPALSLDAKESSALPVVGVLAVAFVALLARRRLQ